MTSAVFASRNKPCWGEPKVYVRKYPNPTPTLAAASASAAANLSKANNSSLNYSNPLFKAKPNPNLNKPTRAHDPTINVHFKESTLPAEPDGLASSNELSRFDRMTYNLGAYTMGELKSLKKFLLSDLERVRKLRDRIENSNFQALPICPTTQPLSLPNGPTRAPKRQNKGSSSKRANAFGNPKAKRVAKGRPPTLNVMRGCGGILTKLMKDKQGWVFNTPVDVVSLRLHDYHNVIKKPMDLGTVRSNLKTNVYKSQHDFAEDVRLTFKNALMYNPKGHYVYVMAETLLAKFEEMFEKLSQRQQQKQRIAVEQEEGAALVKQKGRVMSLEEKIVLGRSLAELRQEEINELWGIIKKRNGSISLDGDEIELDIEALDDDMLWELDRFVSNNNSKQATSKSKTEKEPISSSVPVASAVAAAEEEVDIGEEFPVENYPPVEIERDVDVNVNSSGSSGSSSGSYSSSGSDSGSSSDDDTAQSPFAKPKDAPMDGS